MKAILKWNPEFARNIWTELTPQRLIVMPALIGLVVLLISMLPDDNVRSTLHVASMAGIAVLGFLWGIKTSADAILDEFNEKTWDWQKMSVIGPWKLAWGKLFGSTIYNWYGALICFVIYILTSFGAQDPAKEIHTGLLLLIGMVSIHGIMILISLLMIRKNDGRSKIKSNRIFISGLVALISLSNIFSGSLLSEVNTPITWYGIVSGSMNLTTLSALFYCAWIVAGLYRSMRAELQFTDAPVWWIGFILSSVVFHYGYFAGMEILGTAGGISAAMAVSFFEFLMLLYLLALSEPKDIVNFRQLLNTWNTGEKKTFFRNLPLWITTLPFVFLLGLLAVVFFNLASQNSVLEEIYRTLKIHGASRSFPFLIALYGFIIRDLGILIFFNLSNNSKRADSAWIIYLLVMYVLLPMLVGSADLPFVGAFYPDITANIFVMIVIPILEAVGVVFLVWNRWKQIKVD
jgi:hypothetical protein